MIENDSGVLATVRKHDEIDSCCIPAGARIEHLSITKKTSSHLLGGVLVLNTSHVCMDGCVSAFDKRLPA